MSLSSHKLILQVDSSFSFDNYKYFLLLSSFLSSKLFFVKYTKNNLIVFVSRFDLNNCIQLFKLNQYLQFKLLIDIFGIDNIKYNKRWRFEVVYHLISVVYTSRLFIKTNLNEFEFVESITNIFKGAVWFEREVWDMFGIFFTGHSDLRRILTDYGFNGFPLRKDFPLSGFIELRYSDYKAAVVYEPLTLTQEYRYFNFLSPWTSLD